MQWVSWVLGRPASPVAVLRSSTQRGEWVLAWAAGLSRKRAQPLPPQLLQQGLPCFTGPLPAPTATALLSPGPWEGQLSQMQC